MAHCVHNYPDSWKWLNPENNIYQLTSESGPLSAPGHWNVTHSWQRLCTTKLHTVTASLAPIQITIRSMHIDCSRISQ